MRISPETEPFFTICSTIPSLAKWYCVIRCHLRILALVFHRKLDFKTGQDFYPALFVLRKLPFFVRWLMTEIHQKRSRKKKKPPDKRKVSLYKCLSGNPTSIKSHQAF